MISMSPGSPQGSTPVGAFTPVMHHWFYCKNIELRQIWQPFSIADSIKLEDALRGGTFEILHESWVLGSYIVWGVGQKSERLPIQAKPTASVRIPDSGRLTAKPKASLPTPPYIIYVGWEVKEPTNFGKNY